jgi:hypothetical protein
MGRLRKDGNHYAQKDNSILDSVGNEENVYPVPDTNKTKINVIKEPSDTHKKTKTKPSKRKFWKVSLKNSWKRY